MDAAAVEAHEALPAELVTVFVPLLGVGVEPGEGCVAQWASGGS